MVMFFFIVIVIVMNVSILVGVAAVKGKQCNSVICHLMTVQKDDSHHNASGGGGTRGGAVV
jgi:hypothetical protein